MTLEQETITYKGMPLFQKATMLGQSSLLADMQNMACFFYVVQGEYETIESHGAYRMSEKEALIKRCGNYVSHFLSSPKSENCEAVAIYLFPEVLHEVYKNEVPKFLLNPNEDIAPKKMVNNALIEEYMHNLAIYFRNPELIDEDLALLKLKEFIMILLKSEQYLSVQQFLSEIFSAHKLRFTSIIENNLFSNLSIEELAFLCGKSLSGFKRDFKKAFKTTPARYIKTRRLERAAKLLQATEDPISTIAYECAFHDATTFSANFQTHFGCSPSIYRLDQTRK